jgi:hypothetical protein
MLSEYSEAVDSYTEASVSQKSLSKIAILKRALALIELKRYQEALLDLDSVTKL